MEFQHVNVKLFVKNDPPIDLEPLIPVFHRWIQDQTSDELLLDVADYRHVRSGPGVVLIGHYGNLSVDNTGGNLGVRYNRKAPLGGTNQDRLLQAAHAALLATERLQAEPDLAGGIRFNGRDVEVAINDRLLAPNTPETRAAAEPEFKTFFSALFGGARYVPSYPQDSRSLLSVQVHSAEEFDTAALLSNLSLPAPSSRRR